MKRRVLLCDDDTHYAARVERYLMRTNVYDVYVCSSIQESIDELDLDRQRDPWDRYAVVIIDLVFKSNSRGGFEILSCARRCRYIETIVFTGFGNEVLAAEAVQLGAFRYVPKDAKGFEKLLLSLAEAVESNSAIVELAEVVDDIAANGDKKVLLLVKRAFELILKLRGR